MIDACRDDERVDLRVLHAGHCPSRDAMVALWTVADLHERLEWLYGWNLMVAGKGRSISRTPFSLCAISTYSVP